MKKHVIYGDMLLLSTRPAALGALSVLFHGNEDESQKLFAEICKIKKVSRIAINQPIPLSTKTDGVATTAENMLRSPLDFTPLYGDFGPSGASSPASRADYDEAYWVTARQNGIAQTWAPRWTMFSRGNISEKARLLSLTSVLQAVDEGECSAVDLYAGIGYFAFCYIKSGVTKVLCWELNEWSCEGLRRGADANRWRHKTVDPVAEVKDVARSTEQIIIFQESNEHALGRLQQTENLPPVRHVNCGLLPTSKLSWPIAIHSLSPELGGWVHVHENFALADIETSAESVRQTFQQMLTALAAHHGEVVLEGIHRVKSYAPSVWHCVLDIYVPPYHRKRPNELNLGLS